MDYRHRRFLRGSWDLEIFWNNFFFILILNVFLFFFFILLLSGPRLSGVDFENCWRNFFLFLSKKVFKKVFSKKNSKSIPIRGRARAAKEQGRMGKRLRSKSRDNLEILDFFGEFLSATYSRGFLSL